MKTRFNKMVTYLVSAAILMVTAPADMHAFAGERDGSADDSAVESQVRVSVRAEDYTAVAAGIEGASETGMIADTQVMAGTPAEAVEKALTSSNVKFDMSMGYVSEVNGLSAADGYYMSGWMLAYNNDDCDNWGLDYINLEEGSTITLIYSLDGGADIAAATSGLPTLKTLDIADVKYEFETVIDYDENWIASYTYKVNGEEMEGAGTENDPFLVNYSIAPENKDGNITYSYTTYANPNYVSVSDAGDYITSDGDNEIVIISRGGRKAYYNIRVITDAETPTPTGTPEPTATPAPTGTPEPTATPVPTVPHSSLQTEAPAQTPEVQPKAPGQAKIKSAKLSKKKLNVTVKKVNGAKGYKITVAADKAFKKNKKVRITAKTSVIFRKCTKKRYYVKVQAYVTGNDGKKIYGRESKAVRVK